MAKIAKVLSANEMLEILKKPYLSSTDIKKVACVGNTKALEIKNTITTELSNQNYFLPSGLVPTDKVIDYLKLNISYLRKMAKQEKVITDE